MPARCPAQPPTNSMPCDRCSEPEHRATPQRLRGNRACPKGRPKAPPARRKAQPWLVPRRAFATPRAVFWGVKAGMTDCLSASCILDFVHLIEHSSRWLWSLWAKAGAVGNAQRCPRQARRCAAGASSTNPQPASVWRRSSSASGGGLPTPRLSSECGAISSSVARTVAWAHSASCRCSSHVRQGRVYE